jgi:D-alanyl-lipoteichoic acid acyltransferase DltB (MBOAT superfamily)
MFSLAAGLSINFFVFGSSAAAMFAINLACYFMMRVFPSDTQHIGVFVVAGVGLCGAQLHRMIWDYGQNSLDLAICLMYNYCRITSLACCIKDGTMVKRARDKLKDGQRKVPLKELGVDLKARELRFALEETPSFVEFLSYIYFCGAAISGPWYEFSDFNNMINLSGDFASVPSTVRPALRRYLDAWLCVAVGSFFDHYFPNSFLLTDEFAAHSLLWKIGYSYGTLKNMMYRTYMIGWCLMEVGPIASGLAYNGNDESGKPKFDRV